ncbi:MAG: hypothetical protein ACOC41_05440 [Chitinivibrionales bacterium]
MKTNQDLIDGVLQEARDIPLHTVAHAQVRVNVYLADFGKILFSMDQNEQQWLDAGFDWLMRYYYQALHDELLRTQSVIIANPWKASSARAQWLKKRTTVLREWIRLKTLCKNMDTGIPQQMDTSPLPIPRLSLDRLHEIQHLSTVGLKNFDIIREVKIEGTNIDKKYLEDTQKWANDFTRFLDSAETVKINRSEELLLRNRLLMLCHNSEEQIHSWLNSVYHDTPEKRRIYDDFYRYYHSEHR